jgi:hypothetical protein
MYPTKKKKRKFFTFFFKISDKAMYKRILNEADRAAPSTPTKRVAQARLVVSPSKGPYDNSVTTYVRDIVDPEDHTLLGVTFEGVYDLRQFFSGMSPILDNANNEKKCPVSGMR